MKLGLMTFAALMILSGALFAQGADVIVGFHGDADATVITKEGGTVKRVLNGAVSGRIPLNAVGRIRQLENVAYIEQNAIVTTQIQDRSRGKGNGKGGPPPADPEQKFGWGVLRLMADVVWGDGTLDPDEARGSGVLVAVIDSGVDMDHPDLAPVAAGPDYVNNDSDPDDDNEHGTHVAGIIGARDNDIGYVGVAPSVDLVAVKVLDANGSGWTDDVVAGMNWAHGTGNADVMNLSLGGADTQSKRDAVDAANAAGTLVVGAIGNSGDTNRDDEDTVSFPGGDVDAIGVASTNANDAPSSFSTSSWRVDVAAPGGEIPSTVPGGLYDTFGGTSMATPHVSGAAALVIANNPGLTVSQVRDRLQDTAIDLYLNGEDNAYGHGLINAYDAVFNVTPPAPPAQECRVGGFDCRFQVKGKKADLYITVLVVDQGGTPLNSALVDISVSGIGTGSASTNSQGEVTFRARNVSAGTYDITVTDVDRSGFPFDNTGNTTSCTGP